MRVAQSVTMAARALNRATLLEPRRAVVQRRVPACRAVSTASNTSHRRRTLPCLQEPRHRRFPAAFSSATDGGGTDGGGTADDPWNKGPINLDARLYGYLLRHTREPDVLRELRVETASLRGSQMQVPPEQGAFLRLLVELIDAKRVLEIGTYTGYSSIAMALALPSFEQGGRLVACDSSEMSMAVARRYWRKAGVEDKIEERLGDGKEAFERLLDEVHRGARPQFDLGFIDADKRGYWQYYDAMVTGLIRKGGLIAVDNVLWYGKVADPEVKDKQTESMRAFNERVFRDERVAHCTIPVGDGITLCRVR